MPRPRFQNLPEERRLDLLQGAATEFARHGYEGGSLNRIISEIGLSKGSFYYYFDDKADLFQSVLEFAIRSALPDDPAMLDFKQWDGSSFWPNAERLYVASLHQMVDLPWYSALGRLIYQPPPELEEAVNAELERIRNLAGEVLDHGIQVGAIRAEEPRGLYLAIVWGALQGSDRWFMETWDDLDREQRTHFAKQGFEIVRRLFQGPGDGPG